MELNLSNKNIDDDDNIFNEINEPEKYVSIDLSHNLLTQLPKNLSKFSNLTTLNITNNKFINYEELALSLSSIPKLQELSLDLATQETVILILTTLPNLIKLNGEKTTDTTLQQSVLSKSNILDSNVNRHNTNSNRIENDKNSVDDIDDLNFEIDENSYNEKGELNLNDETSTFEFVCKNLNNEVFNKKFQIKLRDEISKINANLDISNYLYNAHIIKSKLNIYSFILDEVLNILFSQNDYSQNSNKKIIKIINITKQKIKINQNLLFDLAIQKNESLLPIQSFQEKNQNSSFKNLARNISGINTESNSIDKNNAVISMFGDKNEMISKEELTSLLNELYIYTQEKDEMNKNEHNKISLFSALDPFLLKKYGLKSMASYWKNIIFRSIDYFYMEDSYINLYKKIFENKIEQNYYLTYQQLKEVCVSYFVKQNNLKEEQLNTFIPFNKWNEFINLLFKDNNEYNVSQIISFISEKNKTDNNYKFNNDNSEKSILINDLIEIILDIQINNREKNLEKISDKFNRYDNDSKGYLNKENFINFLTDFNKIKNNNILINEIINTISLHYNSKAISFSDCIEVLSNKIIDGQSLLEYLIL